MAPSEPWGTEMDFNCVWHRDVPSAPPRGAVVPGKDSVPRAVGRDRAAPGSVVTGGWPWGVEQGAECQGLG